MIFNNFGFNTLRATFATIPPTPVVSFTGSYYFGGNFTTSSTTIQNRLSKYATGSIIDPSFNIGSGFNNTVEVIAVQPSDGKILAGGNFTTYSGSSQTRFVRLNTNGTRDTSFNVGSGFSTSPLSIAFEPNGKILVGGFFFNYSGSAINRLVRINTSGTLDTTLAIGSGASGFNNSVRSVALQPNGRILAGGEYTQYQASTQNRLIRLEPSGAKDASFNIGTGFDDVVWSIALQPDEKVLAGGQFTSYSGSAQNRIIRLQPSGAIDTSFNVGTGFNDTVRSIALQSDGKILAGGDFSTYSGSTSNRLVRLNTSGTIDTSFNVGSGFNNSVNSLRVQSDGKVLVGGGFSTYQGISALRGILLNSDGSISNNTYSFDNDVSTVFIDEPIPSAGLLFYYDPGNLASYPGSGSTLYDLSGNARTGSVPGTITWTGGQTASFNLNGTDGNSISGPLLNQNLTSWTMWIAIYRNDQGIGGYDGFMYERRGGNNANGLGTFNVSNQLDMNVNNGTEIFQPGPGTMTVGSWMFLVGAVDDTSYTLQVYKTGDLSTFQTGAKSAGSSSFDNIIVLGEDREAGFDRTMNGKIGPALMYNRKLTNAEITQINQTFKARYGI